MCSPWTLVTVNLGSVLPNANCVFSSLPKDEYQKLYSTKKTKPTTAKLIPMLLDNVGSTRPKGLDIESANTYLELLVVGAEKLGLYLH